MIDLKLDGNRDLVVDGQVEEKEEIKQSIETILLTRKGEFELDPEMGLERSNLLGKSYSEELAVADFYDALREDERVKSSDIHITALPDRKLKIKLSIYAENEPIETEVSY